MQKYGDVTCKKEKKKIKNNSLCRGFWTLKFHDSQVQFEEEWTIEIRKYEFKSCLYYHRKSILRRVTSVSSTRTRQTKRNFRPNFMQISSLFAVCFVCKFSFTRWHRRFFLFRLFFFPLDANSKNFSNFSNFFSFCRFDRTNFPLELFFLKIFYLSKKFEKFYYLT